MVSKGKNIVILLISSLLFICSESYSLQWYDPMEIPVDATQQEMENITSFNNELALAKEDFQNDDYYGMTDHIENALSHRPDHPDNIRLEYKMAVAMSQYRSPVDTRPLRRSQALKLFEKIVDTYNHMDYYSLRPEDSDSIEMPQMIIPRAAIHAASLNMAMKNDNVRARKYIIKGLDCLYETCKKRKEDWLNEPQPQSPPEYLPRREKMKWEMRVKAWKERQQKAQESDVFGIDEMLYARVAVRNYGISFGKTQDIGDVVSAMSEVMKKYPDPPLSKIAAQYIDHAKNVVMSIIEEDFFYNFDGTLPTTTGAVDSDINSLDTSKQMVLQPKVSQDSVPVENAVQQEEKRIQSEKGHIVIFVLIAIAIAVVLIFGILRKIKSSS